MQFDEVHPFNIIPILSFKTYFFEMKKYLNYLVVGKLELSSLELSSLELDLEFLPVNRTHLDILKG